MNCLLHWNKSKLYYRLVNSSTYSTLDNKLSKKTFILKLVIYQIDCYATISFIYLDAKFMKNVRGFWEGKEINMKGKYDSWWHMTGLDQSECTT
jgi:hypothetical protein